MPLIALLPLFVSKYLRTHFCAKMQSTCALHVTHRTLNLNTDQPIREKLASAFFTSHVYVYIHISNTISCYFFTRVSIFTTDCGKWPIRF